MIHTSLLAILTPANAGKICCSISNRISQPDHPRKLQGLYLIIFYCIIKPIPSKDKNIQKGKLSFMHVYKMLLIYTFAPSPVNNGI